MSAEILAAGGLITRVDGDRVRVAVVHRPRYDDWSLPKGKLDEGESFEQAALREVEEETGLRCRIGPELPSTTYRDRHGRSKLVRYWEMTVAGGDFVPNREVDVLRWLDRDEAAETLTYERDRELVRSALADLDGALQAE